METMGFWENLRLGAIASLYVSLFGVPFTLALSGAWALVLKIDHSKWLIPATRHRPERKVRYVVLAVLGGIAGDFAAVDSRAIGEWWICRTQHRLCNEGQGGLMLIFSVPVLAVLGALVAWGWTWLSLRIPPHQPWASIFCYRGSLRWLNLLLALIIPTAFWAFVTLGLIRATL
jgi:hypothetical protein